MSDPTHVSSNPPPLPDDDRWLEPWQAAIVGGAAHAGDALELGCGPGFDTATLLRWGFAVTATEISDEALAPSRERNPGATHLVADARDLARFAEASFDVVVASLSLHYFDRAGTHRAFREAARVLRTGGRFAFRVNADDDHEYGAPPPGQRRAWETVLHRGSTKQFFTAAMIRADLFGRFRCEVLERRTTDRYGKRKSFFAALAVREDECLGLRLATPADAPAIARIHIETWQAAYREILPATFLASLSVAERTTRWEKILHQQSESVGIAFHPRATSGVHPDDSACAPAGIVGWISFGRSRDADAPDAAEIHALYVDAAEQRRGVGAKLMALAECELAARFAAAPSLNLWVLEANTAGRRFYERLGFAPDGAEKDIAIGGGSFRELRYAKRR